ncbi:MAG: hypothetical protein ACYDHU_11325 [Acidimicrobiales bacterium]
MKVLEAFLIDGNLRSKTVGLIGPTEIGFDGVARPVSRVLGKRLPLVRMPFAFHSLLALLAERLTTAPLISLAQGRVLREGVIAAFMAPEEVPIDLAPVTAFAEPAVRAGLPDLGRFGRGDVRWFPGHRQGRVIPTGVGCHDA